MKIIMNRCSELEKSLEMLKAEYEQCEDYWAAKLEEERQIFEQEQKISDEKLAELISKMAEYEEQFSGGNKLHDNGRLSPIEERINLEQQYQDLEEEIERWRSYAQDELAKKDREIEKLHQKLHNVKSSSLADFSVQFPDEQIGSYLKNFTESGSSSKNDPQSLKKTRLSSTRYCPQVK
jgi:DNA repair exonuclease SbcCD ATPase subunit